jgi:hypothetical protein
VQVRAFIICAEWCGVCRKLQASAPLWLNGTLSWIDLDEDEKILEGLDVENFPTLAVYRSDEWVFWGAVEPMWPIIQRTCAMASSPVDKDTATSLSGLLGRAT